MYDIYQITEKLGVSRSTIYLWIRQYAQHLTPDPMAQQRKGGSMAMARMYTDHDLRVFLYVKELRKRNWNQREINAELDRRLTSKNAQTTTSSPLPALIDAQAPSIPAQPADHRLIGTQAPQAPAIPAQSEAPKAPGMYDQAIMAAMFPKYGHSAPSAPAVDQPTKVDPPIQVDPPSLPVIDPPSQPVIVAADEKTPITYNRVASIQPAQSVIVPFKGEAITYNRIPIDQPAAPDGMPDDETLIKWLQKERGDLTRIAWELGNLDEKELWKYVTRSKTLRPIYLSVRGWGGGVSVADLRQANFG